jgi:folylpolyglutamate synthase/dihydropteroate synthase
MMMMMMMMMMLMIMMSSPHMHTVRERIRVGGECIPRGDFVRLWEAIEGLFTEEEDWANFFDKVGC